ncbi:MAG: hypothetical protein E3J25_01320 [Anaerolineales bacterium]|nr:MAG: hypothetical protein E3J25_01320 [Anaerolineales bacterium]
MTRNEEIEAREKDAAVLVRLLRRGAVGAHYVRQAADEIEALETELKEARERPTEAENAALRAALEPFRDCQVKVGMDGLVPTYRTVGMVLDSFDAGKGCEHEFTGGEEAYPGMWSRCLKCKQMALRSSKGWVSPEALRLVGRQAGDAFIRWAEANTSRIHRDALDEAAMGFAAGHKAALDALGKAGE